MIQKGIQAITGQERKTRMILSNTFSIDPAELAEFLAGLEKLR